MRHVPARNQSSHLVRLLQERDVADPVIVGVPGHSMTTADHIATSLKAALDLLMVRSIASPAHPHVPIGAVAEGDVCVIDTVLCDDLRLDHRALPKLVRASAAALDRDVREARADNLRTDLLGRSVILVHQELATGSTAHAAVRSLRRAGASRVTVVAAASTGAAYARVGQVADDVIVGHIGRGCDLPGSSSRRSGAPASGQRTRRRLLRISARSGCGRHGFGA
jgi:putative phosphoribosyl transferase